MDQKKTRKPRKSGAAASGKDLSVKPLSVKAAGDVRGGTHPVDKSSPALLLKCATGTHMKE